MGTTNFDRIEAKEVVADSIEATAPLPLSQLGLFISDETTATGSAQNIAHGLGVVPSKVVVTVTEHPGTPDTGAFDVAEGSHTSTNVVLTVTSGVKFKVLAFV
ncbi:MAG: hypothetical protein AB7R89_06145 [Dehalococcoidia bacterium]